MSVQLNIERLPVIRRRSLLIDAQLCLERELTFISKEYEVHLHVL